MDKKTDNVDGLHVIEQFLLTKGEQMVNKDMKVPFKPLIDFGLVCYNKKVSTTTRAAMKFDLERFFMRRCLGELTQSWETKYVKVPQDLYDKVKAINDQYRNGQDIED